MRLADRIKPISYLKEHADEMADTVGELQEPFILTQDGEAKAVLQDIHSYEKMQETLALLKLLAIGQRQVEAGHVMPVSEAFAKLRAQIKDR